MAYSFLAQQAQPRKGSLSINSNNVVVRFYDESDSLANLLNEIDKHVLVQLRDGKMMRGWLRTIDEFSNLVLTQSVERIYVGKYFGDIPRGVVLIRGDNLVMVGEIDEEKEDKYSLKFQELSPEKILSLQKDVMEEAELKEQERFQAFKNRGLHYIPRQKFQNRSAFGLGEDAFM